MPCELQWDGKILRLLFVGSVTSENLAALMTAVERAEAELIPIPNRLADLRGMTELDGDFEMIHDAARKRRGQRFPNDFKTAIVAGNTLQLGYARMFQILNDNPAITVRIFEDAASATQWLAEI